MGRGNTHSPLDRPARVGEKTLSTRGAGASSPSSGLGPSTARPARRACGPRAFIKRQQLTLSRGARRMERCSARRETRGDDAGSAPAQHDPPGACRAAPRRAARLPPRAAPEHQKVSFFTSSWKLEAFTKRRAPRTAKHHANLRFRPARRVQKDPGRRGVPMTLDTLCVAALRSRRAPLRAAPRRAGEPPRVLGQGLVLQMCSASAALHVGERVRSRRERRR